MVWGLWVQGLDKGCWQAKDCLKLLGSPKFIIVAVLLSAKLELPQRVQIPNNKGLGFWVIVIIAQVLGKYMMIRYLDP